LLLNLVNNPIDPATSSSPLMPVEYAPSYTQRVDLDELDEF